MKRSRYIRATQSAFLLVWLCTAAFGLEEDKTTPAPLVLSSVEATRASKDAGLWRDKGYGGFLLRGIVEGGSVRGGDSAGAGNADSKESLRGELRVAQERLSESGLVHNFVYVSPGCVDGWFVPGESGAEVVQGVGLASSFCSVAGLCGVALDTCSSSGFYDYGWDGYAYDGYSPSDLAKNARRLGASVSRAVLRELPGSEFLVISDGWSYSGALWLPFFEGVLEGAAGDDGCRVRLLTRGSLGARSGLDLARVARETLAALEQRLGPRAGSFWRRQGTLSLGLTPVKRGGGAGRRGELMGPGEFRRLVAAAKALSEGGVWIESDAGLYAYDVRMPYDSWRRAGPLEGYGVPGEVYSTPDGAAVVLWGGVPGELTLTGAGNGPKARDLAEGKPVEWGKVSGSVVLARREGPVLVEGLPAWPWLVRAGLAVEVVEAPAPGGRAGRLSYDFRNTMNLAIEGSVSFLAPPGYGASPERVRFALAPGEELLGGVNVFGDFGLGRRARFKASVAVRGGEVLTEALEVGARPRELWRCGLDGDAAGNFVVAELDGRLPRELVACTGAGEVACINAETGALKWKRRFAGSFRTKPVAGVLATGEAAVAVMDGHGVVRVLNRVGEEAWERQGGRLSLPPVFADVDEFGGEEVVLPHSDGHIVVLGAGGQEIREYRPLLGISWLGAARGADGKPVLAAVEMRPMRLVAGLDGSCRLRWSRLPEAGMLGWPVLADVDGDGLKELAAALETGAVIAWDPASGEEVARFDGGLCRLRALAAGGEGVRVEPVESELGHVGAVCVDGEGRELWRMDEGPSVTGLPLVADLDGSGRMGCVYSDSSRSIRAFGLK